MNAISISLSLLIALFAILVLYRRCKLPQISGYGSQRMCPSCRVDHISIKGVLLGVWQISYSGECDPDCRKMNRWLLANRFSGGQK